MTTTTQTPAAPPPPAAQPFSARLALGLVGVLIAALTSGLNDRVTDIALIDVRGVLGIDHDAGSWFSSAYEAAEVSAMMLSAWFAVTLSIRRFAIAVVVLFALAGSVFPFVHTYPALIAMRIVQGLLGGMLPPLLMTVALRFLPPPVKLYGLSAYALTATFGPNLAMPLAGLWTDLVGWRYVYWQVIPLCATAAAMIAYGLPQDPLRLERFRQFNWVGVVTGCGGVAMLVVALTQGERLDWFDSPLISALLASSAVALVLFGFNEWHHPLPLFKLQILGRRNFSHGLITLSGLLILFMAGSALPAQFLSEVRDLRPLQIGPLALCIAIPQLIAAPAAATLCNIARLDSRFVLGSGLALLAASCVAGSLVTSAWSANSFYLIQALQALGQPLAVVPILMGATGTVLPPEGPFASAMFNTVRGLATVVGSAVVETLITHRDRFHSAMLLDNVGNRTVLLHQAPASIGNHAAPFSGITSTADSGSLAAFSAQIHGQVLTMSIADLYLILAGVALALIVVMLLLPVRAWPPGALPRQSSR